LNSASLPPVTAILMDGNNDNLVVFDCTRDSLEAGMDAENEDEIMGFGCYVFVERGLEQIVSVTDIDFNAAPCSIDVAIGASGDGTILAFAYEARNAALIAAPADTANRSRPLLDVTEAVDSGEVSFSVANGRVVKYCVDPKTRHALVCVSVASTPEDADADAGAGMVDGGDDAANGQAALLFWLPLSPNVVQLLTRRPPPPPAAAPLAAALAVPALPAADDLRGGYCACVRACATRPVCSPRFSLLDVIKPDGSRVTTEHALCLFQDPEKVGRERRRRFIAGDLREQEEAAACLVRAELHAFLSEDGGAVEIYKILRIMRILVGYTVELQRAELDEKQLSWTLTRVVETADGRRFDSVSNTEKYSPTADGGSFLGRVHANITDNGIINILDEDSDRVQAEAVSRVTAKYPTGCRPGRRAEILARQFGEEYARGVGGDDAWEEFVVAGVCAGSSDGDGRGKFKWNGEDVEHSTFLAVITWTDPF
jgi:hypothetical protein